LTPVEAVTLLAAGPDTQEKAQGLRTEVPTNVTPMNVTTNASGTILDVAIDPNSLSIMAISQLVCTALSAIAGQTTPLGAPGAGFSIAGAGRTIVGPHRCR
jgi:hypothetical protein